MIFKVLKWLVNHIYKNKVLNVLAISLLILSFTELLHAQSYTIKTILTRTTELVPGNDDLKVINFVPDDYAISNNGDIVFVPALSDGSGGIIRYSNGNLELLAKTVKAQAVNEEAFLNMGFPNINDKGEIVIFANVSGKTGIFKLFNEEIIPLVITGDPINGLEFTIEGVSRRAPSLNNRGEIVFNGTLSDRRRGLFLFKEEQGIKAILLEGDQFSVFNGEETIRFADSPTINDKSEIVFRAGFFSDITKSEDVDSSAYGIFLFRNEEFIPVKLPGTEVPRTNGNIFFPFHFNRPFLGNN